MRNQPGSFTINNIAAVGEGDLHLKSTPYVIVSGTDASFFSVTTQPVSGTIAPTGFQTFAITFNPSESTVTGLKTAQVSIFSDDPDTPVYTFTVQGTVGVPDINIHQAGSDLPMVAGSYDYGNVNKGSTSAEVTFTIENTGRCRSGSVGRAQLCCNDRIL